MDPQTEFFHSLPQQATLSGLRSSSKRCRIVGVFAPWCSACHRVRPYFIDCVRQANAWDEYNGLDLTWIDGDGNDIESLRPVGIDLEGFPTFFMRLPHEAKWTRIKTSLFSTPQSLRRFWLDRQKETLAELQQELVHERQVAPDIARGDYIKRGDTRLMRPTEPFLFVPRIVRHSIDA